MHILGFKSIAQINCKMSHFYTNTLTSNRTQLRGSNKYLFSPFVSNYSKKYKFKEEKKCVFVYLKSFLIEEYVVNFPRTITTSLIDFRLCLSLPDGMISSFLLPVVGLFAVSVETGFCGSGDKCRLVDVISIVGD